jgi:chemotaxis-related protein WspD
MVDFPFASPDHAGDASAPPLDDCWRRIGVQGDASCARLTEHIHCRNCPVHARAAVTLLDQLPVDADGAGERALTWRSAPSSAPVSAPTRTLSCLVFRVGPEWLALPAAALAEVSAPCPLHTLPHRRHPAIVGLASVRGSLLVCISLARLLGVVAEPPSADPAGANGGVAQGGRLLIMGHGRDALAMPVDEIAGVERVDMASLKPLPTTVVRASGHLTQGLIEAGGRTAGLLDPGLLQQAMLRSAA